MTTALAQNATPGDYILWIFLGVVGLVCLFIFFVMLGVLKLYVQALFSDAKVGMVDLIMMRLRKVPPEVVVLNRISAKKAGLDIPTDLMEAHYLARGNISRVVAAMIAADKAAIELPWNRATAIDLAGRDILDAVQTSVNPKVIDCP
ncbi:MAG: flotillin-like FloA family protein, partial [Phycisphaerales bacterium]